MTSRHATNGSVLHPSALEPQQENVLIPSAREDVTATSGRQTRLTGSHKSFIWTKRLGFQARYEFYLWAFFSSFMAFFVLIRSPYLNFSTFERRSSPGEWYWFGKNPYHFAIFLHLYTTLPAGSLSIIQFLPVVRSRLPSVHKYVGYAIIVFLTLGNIAIAVISRISMGGNDLSLTAVIVVLSSLTSVALGLAWYNIRKQQIDEHRKWMLRAMFWMGIIITMRVVMFIVIVAVSYTGGFYTLWTCDQAQSITGDTAAFREEFPACHLGPQTYIGVPADLETRLHIGSAVRLTFSMATWLALTLHAVGVEIYIRLTPKENERLRMISYRKQQALGLSPAGSAGLTADRLGSSYPWVPAMKKA